MNFTRYFRIMLLPIVAVACNDSGRRVQSITTRDSSGVEITDIPGRLVAAAPEWQSGPQPLLVLGQMEPGDASQYHRITGVRMVSVGPNSGSVMFSSDASKQLFTFDSTGEKIGSHGRVGNGPFEFQHLQMIASADSTLVVLYDALRSQITELPVDVFEPTALSLAEMGISRSNPLLRFSDGEFLAQRVGPIPQPQAKGVVSGVDSLVRFDRAGALVASFGGHRTDDDVIRLNPSGGLTGGRPPYGRKLLVAGDDSVVVVAATGNWELWLYPPRGGLPHIVRIDRPRRKMEAATRKEYRERVLSNVRDEYGKREWTMLSNDDVFPKEYPAFDLLTVDRLGKIWVRESAAHTDLDAQWVVLERTGVPLARVQLPSTFTPYDISRDRIAGVWVDSLDGEQVQVLSLSRK